jgi:nucleoside 2-deoxyribosyltransferase
MNDTKPKAFVFVLMPFAESFGDIYEVGIKQACRDAGAYCERVDEQIFVESILERVYNQIAKADVIIAEMTGRNPNVFYEVGYAHALNKQVILLTQNAEDIPFDLKHYPHIVYGGKIAILKKNLEPRVRWCIENPKLPLVKVDWRLDLFVNDVPLRGAPQINAIGNFSDGRFYLTISIHNPTNSMISGETFDLAIVIPPGTKPVSGFRNSIAQSDGGFICGLPRVPSIFPDGWEGIRIDLMFTKDAWGEVNAMSLRLFKEVGSEEFPFVVKTLG